MGFLLLAGAAIAQPFQRHQISLSGGWGEQLRVYSSDRQTGAALGVSYGYRPLKFLQLDGGLLTLLQPREESCSAHGCYDPNDAYFWVPFGVRFVIPLPRAEVSAGGGGLFQRYRIGPGSPANLRSYSAWGGYVMANAAFGVSRRIWLGATPRLVLANPSYTRDRWFVITGDVSVRF